MIKYSISKAAQGEEVSFSLCYFVWIIFFVSVKSSHFLTNQKNIPEITKDIIGTYAGSMRKSFLILKRNFRKRVLIFTK
jgi:hypothetical protein